MSKTHRAMIMAAGLGTRMAPLTVETPKPLIELNGKPLIDHAIDRLIRGGVNFIVVNVHYKAEQIIAHVERRGGVVEVVVVPLHQDVTMRAGDGDVSQITQR